MLKSFAHCCCFPSVFSGGDYARPGACLNRARCLHRTYLFYYSVIVARSWRVLRSFRMSDTGDCQHLLEKKPTAPVLPSFLTYFGNNGFLSILRLFSILPRNVLTRAPERFVSDLSRREKTSDGNNGFVCNAFIKMLSLFCYEFSLHNNG